MTLADLSNCRILLSNDDGIAAPGLKLLEKVARQLSGDVWVVAPELEQSGAGHSLTLRRPLRIRQAGRRRFAVDGTPTDAVLLGINHILKGKKPDLMLSGINRGGNMGEDVTYSGTIAAAMEATLLGVPSIAFSLHTVSGGPVHWKTPEAMTAEIVTRLVTAGWPKNVLINVNFPDLPPDQVGGIKVVRQGRRKLGDQLGERVDMRGEHYYWIGPMRQEEASQEGSDLWAVEHGLVSITPLDLDLTHDPTSHALAKLFPMTRAAHSNDPRVQRLVATLIEAGIRDDRVLAVIEHIPRELFVPATFTEHAYDNTALPIGQGQTVSQPQIVAMMTEALRVNRRMKVLEIGTGSGYQTAVLSALSRRVYTIERHKSLLLEAEARLAELGVHNVTSRLGDGSKGWPEQAPFDRIMVTAAADVEVPQPLMDQLAIGGILVAPVAASPIDQRLLAVTRMESGVEIRDLGPVRFVPLVGEQPSKKEPVTRALARLRRGE